MSYTSLVYQAFVYNTEIKDGTLGSTVFQRTNADTGARFACVVREDEKAGPVATFVFYHPSKVDEVLLDVLNLATEDGLQLTQSAKNEEKWFKEMIAEAKDELPAEKSYKFMYTGHEIGALFAELMGCKHQVFTVAIESPGARPFLKAADQSLTDYKSILNITGAPNLLNKFFPQVGVRVAMPRDSAQEQKFLYKYMQKAANAFNKHTQQSASSADFASGAVAAVPVAGGHLAGAMLWPIVVPSLVSAGMLRHYLTNKIIENEVKAQHELESLCLSFCNGQVFGARFVNTNDWPVEYTSMQAAKNAKIPSMKKIIKSINALLEYIKTVSSTLKKRENKEGESKESGGAPSKKSSAKGHVHDISFHPINDFEIFMEQSFGEHTFFAKPKPEDIQAPPPEPDESKAKETEQSAIVRRVCTSSWPSGGICHVQDADTELVNSLFRFMP